MVEDFSFPKPTPWLQRVWQDLQPTPGRLNSSLRMTLASILVLVLMLVLQMPYIAYGLYFMFLIGRESPSVSLRTAFVLVVTIVLVIVVEMAVVIVSDNDPMARVLSVAIVTFIGGMILVSTSLPSLGGAIGFIYCVVIGFWEHHAHEDTIVKNSLRLVAAFAIAAVCGVAVEYIFGARAPADRLEDQFRIRYQSLEEMFSLCAREGVSPKQRFDAAARVSRLAAAGQTGMMDLYNQIVDRNLDTGYLPIGTRVQITMLAELMDHSAAFGLQSDTRDDPEFIERCARIAEQCGRLIPAAIPQSEKRLEPGPQTTNTLLDRVEATIHSILVMPVNLGAAKNKELAVLPSRNVPFLIPGAIRDKDNIAFALKISLCATVCYIVYNAIDWPGVSTSVTTVMVTGLSTTAAMKQRVTLRILGSLLGGLLLGLGTIALLFPYMDSITSLIVLVGTIAFAASWISGGSRFNYLGIQVAFAFYLVALLDFSASTELAPARDRFIGIIFALVVMWFVFDQIWPVRTVTAMRRVLASVLRSGASLFLLIDAAEQRDQLLRETESVRDRVGKNISALRTMSEAVEYEFGVDRDQHLRSSELILQISITSAALIWNQVAVLHDQQGIDVSSEPGLVEMRRKLADHMNVMAEAIGRKTGFPPESSAGLASPSLLNSEHNGEYTRNTIARYEDLQNLASALSREA
ncbi:FUSC family protein [Edaphobacter modestus]|uniref:Multidrug resistance protein MdtO n=1 Tax=Edaphobacter modestus TaxID=388466 RepID=A0A4V6MFX2_9BACT|nr:FUSC family protein [Edaphobacter modestus]RZU43646.1 multidrug resistance protein MdtO [Edaphobacter modestus]